MNRLEQELSKQLQHRQNTGNLRHLSVHREPIDFFSNDYLGLSYSGVLEALGKEKYTVPGAFGATGSRLLSGNTAEAEELEEKIAAFHGAEAALLFNSGYNANIGLISAIGSRHTTIIYDELCHASIIDGIRLSLAVGKFKFRHNDLQQLSEKLKRYASAGPLIVIVESIYSMDGDAAPLAAIATLCAAMEAQLIVDEAHATGVFGPHGEGMVCALGLENLVFARVHTFGKALGCHGAVVVGSALLRQYLINFARSFIYTTALPPHAIQAIDCAYSWLASSNAPVLALHQLIAAFRNGVATARAENWVESSSAIQVLLAPGNVQAKALATSIQARGMQIKAILSPTVPTGKERIRVCLHTFNSEEQVNNLLQAVIEHLRQ